MQLSVQLYTYSLQTCLLTSKNFQNNDYDFPRNSIVTYQQLFYMQMDILNVVLTEVDIIKSVFWNTGDLGVRSGKWTVTIVSGGKKDPDNLRCLWTLVYLDRDHLQFELDSLRQERYRERKLSRDCANEGYLKREDRYAEYRLLEFELFFKS